MPSDVVSGRESVDYNSGMCGHPGNRREDHDSNGCESEED